MTIDRFSAFEGGQRRIERAQPVANYRQGTVSGPSRPSPSVVRPPSPVAAVRPPDPEGLIIGEQPGTAGAVAIDLGRLLDGRLLIQGVSGAGKSWTLRRLLEQASGHVQALVIDPEGEFDTLATELGILKVDGSRLDPAALRQLAERCRAHRTSLVLDLSDCDRERQLLAAAPFIEGLIEAPREHWHPCLVAIDEAHLFAPFGGHTTAATSVRKAAIGAVVDLMGRGRKRGLVGVLATQRLARLAKSVTSEVQNFLIGLNTQDLDIKRAADQIGWEARRAFDRLPVLQPGEFIAVGRAFSRQPAQIKVGPVRSEHKGATPEMGAPPSIEGADAHALLGLEELLDQSVEDLESVEASQSGGTRAVRAFLREPAFGTAAAIFGALAEIAPKGSTPPSLAKHLDRPIEGIAAAVALLDSFGVVRFGGHGAVALAAGFAAEAGETTDGA